MPDISSLSSPSLSRFGIVGQSNAGITINFRSNYASLFLLDLSSRNWCLHNFFSLSADLRPNS